MRKMIVEPVHRGAARGDCELQRSLRSSLMTYLQAHCKECEDRGVAGRVQWRDCRVQALCQARQQIKRHDQEGLVRFISVEGIISVILELDQGLLDDRDATLKHRLCVIDETLSNGDHDRRQALRKVTDEQC